MSDDASAAVTASAPAVDASASVPAVDVATPAVTTATATVATAPAVRAAPSGVGASISIGSQAPAAPAAVLVMAPPAVPVAPLAPAMLPSGQFEYSRPWPPVLETPVGQTVCNYVSMCRTRHGYAFLLYILILVVVIVLVWLARNGTLSLFNSALGVTISIGVLILLMFGHWYWFMKGVIPECAKSETSLSGSLSIGVTGRAAAEANAVPPAAASAGGVYR
jgi:hypothetical protein